MAHLLSSPPVRTVGEYIDAGGGLGLERAVQIGPEATIEQVRRSGLRGRGGAGFPTGRKWASVRGQPGTYRYAVANGAEGEPGTFKDRALMRANPYQLVEGLIIAAFAIGALETFIAVKESFGLEADRVTRAVQEMQTAGLCQDCQVTIVRGPDEYLFGEEKALLEVIEGNAPLPRLLPPHEHGLFATAPQSGWEATDAEPGHVGDQSNPTLVNNVETLSNVAHIMSRGADWFRTMGTEDSPGTLVCTVVGDTRRAGVTEFDMGTPLVDVIDLAGGGVAPGRAVKAVFSGVANPVITASQLGTPLSYDAFAAVGSGLGAGGFIVFDDEACMVEVARQFSRFLSVESCGQCPACKLGTAAITDRLTRIEGGVGGAADLDETAGWLAQVTDGNRCYLPVEERAIVASILQLFSDEVDEHIALGSCPRPKPIPLPKLIDIADGHAVYDESVYRKQPDWTYTDEPVALRRSP